jgi:YD repeat-containing protein
MRRNYFDLRLEDLFCVIRPGFALRILFGTVVTVCLAIQTSNTFAQTAIIFPSKAHSPMTVDQNGVDLSTGQFIPPVSSRSIGNALSGLDESVGGNDFPNGSRYVGGITVMDPYENTTWAKSIHRSCYSAFVYFGNYRKLFNYVFPETGLYGGHFVAADGSSDILDHGGGHASYLCQGAMTLTTSDGTVAVFDGTAASDFGLDAKHGVLVSLVKPDGEEINIGVSQTLVATGEDDPEWYPGALPEFAVESHPDYVGSSLGWVMQGGSGFGASAFNFQNWGQIRPPIYSIGSWSTTEGAAQLLSQMVQGKYTQKQRWAKVQYLGDVSYDFKVKQFVEHRNSMDCYVNNTQDPAFEDNLRTKSNMFADYFITVGSSICNTMWDYTIIEKFEVLNNAGIKIVVDYYLPTDDFNKPAGNYGGCNSSIEGVGTCVKSVTKGNSVWKYSWSVDGSENVADIEDPQGRHRRVRTIADWAVVRQYGALMTRDEDELGRVTTYEYDEIYPGRLLKVTHPEGNYEQYIYNNRANLTEILAYPKGGGTPVVQSAGFDEICANLKTCNKPNWVKDAKGNQTDYTYSAVHGGILSVTAPAGINGVRPQTHYEYTQLNPQVLGNNDQLQPNPPVWRLTKESVCSTSSTCPGSVNETVTEYAYADNNLLLTAKTVRAGDSSVSATTAYGYDFGGNLIWTDGPRTDVDDKSYTVYNFYRRPTLEIGPDPDGSGPLKRQYVKHFIDRDFRETKTEAGICSDVTFVTNIPTGCTEISVKSFKTMTYDPVTGLLAKTVLGQP